MSNWINSSFELDEIPNVSSKSHSKRERKTFPKKRKKFCKDASAWSQMCMPQAKEDLAIHKKKICDLEEWLEKSLSSSKGNQFQSTLLLLTGPAGSGKTTTVHALAKELKASISEWSCATNESTLLSEGNWPRFDTVYETQISRFRDFLLRANKYPSLCTAQNNRITLIEEFPNAFLKDPSSFHTLMRQFHKIMRSPTIFVVSDCTSGNLLEDLLFPKDLQFELGIQNIVFNPVSHTMLLKAIKRVCSLQSVNLSKETIENIATNSKGDVRSATNMLQFLTTGNVGSLSLSASKECKRDSSLYLFHALGKILYCKRNYDKPCDNDKLPAHLAHLGRHPLQTIPEEVMEKTSISADGFSLFLHENYSNFMEDIHHAANSARYFSEVDSLCSEWSGRDTLSSYASSIVSRGLMFHMRPNSSRSRWCPLRKSQYYSSMKNHKISSLSLKNAFIATRLSAKEIQTELVPYLFQIGGPSLNSEQVRFVKQYGQLPVTSLHPFRLGQDALSSKDVIKEECGSQVDVLLSSPRDSVCCEDSEDFIIEDFDDEI